MKNKSEIALELYNEGFNCAQAVFGAFSEEYGLDKSMAFKLTGGMGKGFRSGELCGAVSGAALVIGLKYGQTAADDAEAKAECGTKTAEFMKAFKRKNKFLTCRDILSLGARLKEENEEAGEKSTFKTVCHESIYHAATILEEQGY